LWRPQVERNPRHGDVALYERLARHAVTGGEVRFGEVVPLLVLDRIGVLQALLDLALASAAEPAAALDLAPFGSSISEAEFSTSISPRAKPGPQAPRGTRQGLNGYTQWFASDKQMAGEYFGYDGPCPPWNDSVVHRYI